MLSLHVLDFSRLAGFWLFFPWPWSDLHIFAPISSPLGMPLHQGGHPIPLLLTACTDTCPSKYAPRDFSSLYSLQLHAGLYLQGWIFRVGVSFWALCLHVGKLVLEFGCRGPEVVQPLSVINRNNKLSTMFTKHNIKTIKHIYNRILK